MRHRLIWADNQLQSYRGSVGDERPQFIEADRSEIVYSNENSTGYPIGIKFIRNDEVVATFFQLPLGVLVDDVQE